MKNKRITILEIQEIIGKLFADKIPEEFTVSMPQNFSIPNKLFVPDVDAPIESSTDNSAQH